MDRRGLRFTGVVQRPGSRTLRRGIHAEGHGLLLALDARLAFRGLLLEQVFAVHFGTLQLILDVTGIVGGGPLHLGGISGLLALEAGVAAFWLGRGHGSCFS